MYLLKVGASCFHTLRQVECLQKLQLEKISVLFFTFVRPPLVLNNLLNFQKKTNEKPHTWLGTYLKLERGKLAKLNKFGGVLF